LRENYPFGLFAVPREEVIRVHVSSGTAGKPTVVGYTRKDIETWADIMARDVVMVGVTKNGVFQNSVNYGFFTGGIGGPLRHRALGCHGCPLERREHRLPIRNHEGLRNHRPPLHPLL
jgi:phenylacetate-coenzyme A ligase PaaK-like adenylate-forming protein